MTASMIIGGEHVPALDGAIHELVNPATEDVIDEVAHGSAADATRAVDAAAAALEGWAATNVYRRAAVLDRAADLMEQRADELAVLTTEESGKPLAEARAEWLSAPNYLRFAAAAALGMGGHSIPSRVDGRRIDVRYEPIGVVGVITAWNFPIYNINRAVSSALAVGCSVVVRPSEYTPRSAIAYVEILHDAGLPAGVANVISGAPGPMADVMLDDVRCRKIAFTGSTRVGKLLMDGASRTVTRLALEMGGNAPVVVFPDADIDEVATTGMTAKNRNCGQACIAPQRFYVHESVVDRFQDAAIAAARAERVGNGLEDGITLGPLINGVQRDRVDQLVSATVDAGAGVATGGRRPASLDRGYFYEPTVLTDVPEDAPLITEEIFGPVLPIVPFATTDEALRMANSSEYGLAGFVWTRDGRTANEVASRLEYGLVGVNDWYPVTPEAPFGGVKQSGIGRESGVAGLHEYVETKTVYTKGLG